MKLFSLFLIPLLMLTAIASAADWKQPIVLENGYSSEPEIAMASNGYAVGVWSYFDPNTQRYGI